MLKKDLKISNLLETVLSGESSSKQWRQLQLKRLQNLIIENEREILNALNKDLKKPETEGFYEIIALNQELKITKENLSKWMKRKRIKIPISLQPGQAFVQPEPLGRVLIIGPWNYPFSLTLQPLISALAAGNTAVLKPSEHAINTSSLINKLVSKYFPDNVVQVYEGDGTVAEELLKEKFDHIFFTGGENIGRKVMTAAANNLTPTTLELGGKSPAIIIDNTDIEVTSRRIIWGKSLNAGQTCIAPDYLLVKKELSESMIQSMKNIIETFYGKNPLNSKHLSSIINKNQFNRLKFLLKDAKNKNQIISGGNVDEGENRISPTLIQINDKNDPLMQEEIFGPILPILKINNIEEAINIINTKAKPLAIYLFGENEASQEKVLKLTSSGTVCLNDVVLQAGIPNMPFGGVGASGMGQYHGKAGFDTFSHYKSIFKRPFWLDIKFRYPPYSLDISMLRKIM